MQTTMDVKVENRTQTRTDLKWPVSIWLPEANRFFNGRSMNVSKGGALVNLPMSTPVRTGHQVELNFPRTIVLARQKGQFARIKTGKVVRVDRNHTTEDATISIAVMFE
ncbi:MAG: hypothetical protein A2Y07_07835 [Planctomycetes bacterium GWF2_50_10]|nr:MAG: hypothetical protein A2Y07_07835 [Planctomycetes bacterium GWF2_50_10]